MKLGNMEEFEQCLQECGKKAEYGMQISRDRAKLAAVELKQIAQTLQQVKGEYEKQKDCNKLVLRIGEALAQINSDIVELQETLQERIQDKARDMQNFTIALYGRTMVGKSTCMEILTNGDGSSIGKGGQRTTRDIRSYYWHNLKVIDVPGMAAFEGKIDEEKAIRVAEKSDMILFMLSDDAPQLNEADCFHRIIAMGKPVIAVMNIKASIDGGRSMKMKIRNIKKAMEDKNRLEDIKNIFLQYDRKYQQNWKEIKFIYTHLNAEYMARHSQNLQERQELFELSNFNQIEEAIIKEIRQRGSFVRVKTLIDLVGHTLLESYYRHVDKYEYDALQYQTVKRQYDDFCKWIEAYRHKYKKKNNDTLNKITSRLRGERDQFIDDHFDDKNSSRLWEKN